MYYSYGKFAVSIVAEIDGQKVDLTTINDSLGNPVLAVNKLTFAESIGGFPYGVLVARCRSPELIHKFVDFYIAIGDIANNRKIWTNASIVGNVESKNDIFTINFVGASFNDYITKSNDKLLSGGYQEYTYLNEKYPTADVDVNKGDIISAINNVTSNITVDQKYPTSITRDVDELGYTIDEIEYKDIPNMNGFFTQLNTTNVRTICNLSAGLGYDLIFMISNNKVKFVDVAGLHSDDDNVIGKLDPKVVITPGPVQLESTDEQSANDNEVSMFSFPQGVPSTDIYNKQYSYNYAHNMKYYGGDYTRYQSTLPGMTQYYIGENVSGYVGDKVVTGLLITTRVFEFSGDLVNSKLVLSKLVI